MQTVISILDVLLLAPVVGGSVFSVLSSAAVYAFARRRARWPAPPTDARWPAVSLLKPVHGLERDLERNLRTAVSQDYPHYEVVYSAQRTNDPALPILETIAREDPRARLAVAESEPVVNGKVQNMAIGYAASKNAVIVISDSDVRLDRDYLKTIVAPLLDPTCGYVCTLYRATGAKRWFEKIELLTLNGEFGVQLVFAHMTGASDFCLGASTALRRETLERTGGMAPLGDYLVEDYEMGKRVRALGLAPVLVPRHVDMAVDLKTAGDAWRHLVYWDQNTKAARPWGFLTTGLTRAVPFALAYAVVDGFGATGLSVLAIAVALRMTTTAFNLKLAFDDREGLRALPWLPLRDLVALAAWLAALTKRSFVWRGLEFGLTREGRIVPRQLPS